MSRSIIERIVDRRVVGVLAHGKSIEELERRIEEFKDLNICWVGLNLFTIFEDHILSKIHKKLDIVFACDTAPDMTRGNYEINVRLPRIEKFLKREADNIWITTNGMFRDSIKIYRPDLLEKYSHKIMEIDHLFPRENIRDYMEVPNSITLLIGAMIAGGAKKIILFGIDGYNGDPKEGINSYYCKEDNRAERQAVLGCDVDLGINRDTGLFDKMFPTNLRNYRKLFGNNCEVVNCSPNSIFTSIRKINYDQLKDELNVKKT